MVKNPLDAHWGTEMFPDVVSVCSRAHPLPSGPFSRNTQSSIVPSSFLAQWTSIGSFGNPVALSGQVG